MFIAVSRGARAPVWSGILQQSLFDFSLAGEAVTGPRHRLEALLLDLVPALHADSEGHLGDAMQRLVHLLKDLAVGVGQGVEELLGVGARGLVGQVLGPLVLGQAAVGLVLVVHLRQALLLLLKALLVRFELLLYQSHRGAFLSVPRAGRRPRRIPERLRVSRRV